jgi:hypothetical protein
MQEVAAQSWPRFKTLPIPREWRGMASIQFAELALPLKQLKSETQYR